MKSLQEVLVNTRGEDAWGRIDPESVPPPSKEPDVPLTTWDLIWYCLWIPPVLWWISGVNPSTTRLGGIGRWFYFFGIGLPPRGLLNPIQFTLYLAIIVGIPGTILIVAVGMLVPIVAIFTAAVFGAWALVLHRVYFS